MVKVDYSWNRGEHSDEMFFEIYCDRCGNTYNADNIRDECPICYQHRFEPCETEGEGDNKRYL